MTIQGVKHIHGANPGNASAGDRRAVCGAVRRALLTANPGLRELSPEWQQIAQHLAGCPSCSAIAAEHQAWRRIGRRLKIEGISAAVKKRFFNHLALARVALPAGKQRRVRIKTAAGMALAAGLFAASIGTVIWLGPKDDGRDRGHGVGRDEGRPVVAEDHWRALHRAVLHNSNPDEIRTWLAARLSLPVHVVQLEGAEFSGARLCFLDGRVGNVVLYQVEGKPVSYFVMPPDGKPVAGELAAGKSVAGNEASALAGEAAHGFNVVNWQYCGLEYALVGDLPLTRLQMLAGQCREAQDFISEANMTDDKA